jgi:hypothetical protein
MHKVEFGNAATDGSAHGYYIVNMLTMMLSSVLIDALTRFAQTNSVNSNEHPKLTVRVEVPTTFQYFDISSVDATTEPHCLTQLHSMIGLHCNS